MVHLHLSTYQRLVQVVRVGFDEIVRFGDGGEKVCEGVVNKLVG